MANRDAIKAQHRAYNAANRESNKVYAAAYHAKHRDERLAKFREYRVNNKSKRQEQDRRYYLANMPRLRAAAREYAPVWRAKNRGRVVEYSRKRALLKFRAAIGPVTPEGIAARAMVFGGVCAYCGAKWTAMDHVKPLYLGGPHCLSNLRPSCQRCNSRKGRRPAFVWLRNITKQASLPLP